MAFSCLKAIKEKHERQIRFRLPASAGLVPNAEKLKDAVFGNSESQQIRELAFKYTENVCFKRPESYEYCKIWPSISVCTEYSGELPKPSGIYPFTSYCWTSVSFYFCVTFTISMLVIELSILSQWGGTCRDVSLAQYLTSRCSKLIFLCHSRTSPVW